MTIFSEDSPGLDRLLHAADPADPAEMTALATSPAAQAMRDAITSAPAGAPAHSRYLRPALLAAAAVVTALALTFALLPPWAGKKSAYGVELVRFAKSSPLLLVQADGWRVTRADEFDPHNGFGPDDGEMTFAAGTQYLDLHWKRPATAMDSDKHDMVADGYASIAGKRAWVGYYPGSLREYEAIWTDGGRALNARGAFPTRASFLAVAETLHRVDVDTWLAAMPASVVKPDSREATIEQMLADVPQPSGFDISELASSSSVVERYHLGAAAAGAVACAWLEQWLHGTDTQRQEAAQAMATSRDWAILVEMRPQGDYPEVVWEIADAMNGKPSRSAPSGPALEQWAKPGLGC
jgi:hypothetical protein